jgi:phosphoglycerate kinase
MLDFYKLEDFDFKGKKVIVRVDLNLPMRNSKVVDDSRAKKILPTIEYLTKHQAKVILISHFGRPKGKFNIEMSLAPIVDVLNQLLQEKNTVKFCTDTIGEDAIKKVNQLQNSEILLLENLRFYEGEEKNDAKFVEELAKLADIFINDSFSSSHRKHASIVGLADKLPSAAGKLMQTEIANISKFLKSPKKPVTAIIGGAKISTKLSLVENLIKEVDNIIIIGGMANSFLKAQGKEIGKSICEDNLLSKAKEILALASKFNCKITLPSDGATVTNMDDNSQSEIKNIDNIDKQDIILDIGPNSCTEIAPIIDKSKTVIWNGPAGLFEVKPFNNSTEFIARKIAANTKMGKITSIAGGGDVVAAIKLAKLETSFSYISTAGGAFLEWIEGSIIPGIESLVNCKKKKMLQKTA